MKTLKDDPYQKALHNISVSGFTLDQEKILKLKSDLAPISKSAKGVRSVLYPLGGEDVLYPLILFPDVEELYIIDGRPFKNVCKTGSEDLTIYHSALVTDILRSQSESGAVVPISLGFYGPDSDGYDITNPLSYTAHKSDYNHNIIDVESIGTSNLLLARLKATGAEVKSIKAENDEVHTISTLYQGKERHIHFIQADLGIPCEELEKHAGLQWLMSKVKSGVGGILGKGIPNPRVSGGNAQYYAVRDSNIETIINTFSNPETLIILDDHAAKTTLKVNTILDMQTVPAFGYGEELYMGKTDEIFFNTIYTNKSLRDESIKIDLQRQVQQEAQHIKFQNYVEEFSLKSPKERYEDLKLQGIIRQSGNELCFDLKNKDILNSLKKEDVMDIFSKYIPNNSDNVLITSLNIVLPAASGGIQYQSYPASIIESMGDSIKSLKITTANEKTSYVSKFSSEAAKALEKYGKNLSRIEVNANSGGALLFAKAINNLAKNGNLKEFDLAPIHGEWKASAKVKIDKELAMAIEILKPKGKIQAKTSIGVTPVGITGNSCG